MLQTRVYLHNIKLEVLKFLRENKNCEYIKLLTKLFFLRLKERRRTRGCEVTSVKE